MTAPSPLPSPPARRVLRAYLHSSMRCRRPPLAIECMYDITKSRRSRGACARLQRLCLRFLKDIFRENILTPHASFFSVDEREGEQLSRDFRYHAKISADTPSPSVVVRPPLPLTSSSSSFSNVALASRRHRCRIDILAPLCLPRGYAGCSLRPGNGRFIFQAKSNIRTPGNSFKIFKPRPRRFIIIARRGAEKRARSEACNGRSSARSRKRINSRT